MSCADEAADVVGGVALSLFAVPVVVVVVNADDGGGADIGLGDVMPELSSATFHDDVVVVVAFFPPYSSSSRVFSILPLLFFVSRTQRLFLFVRGTCVCLFSLCPPFNGYAERFACLWVGWFSQLAVSPRPSPSPESALVQVSPSPGTPEKQARERETLQAQAGAFLSSNPSAMCDVPH